MNKILKGTLVVLTAFYIGNIAPIDLPDHKDAAAYFKKTKKKVSEVRKKLSTSLPDIDTIKKEKKELEDRVRELESKLKNNGNDNYQRIPDKIIPKKNKPRDDVYNNGFEITPLEQYMIKLVNEQRRLHGVPELRYDNPAIFEAARQHSSEMMELGYFSHTSPVRKFKSVENRFRYAGILPVSENPDGWTTYGENISFVPTCGGDYDKELVEVSMFGGGLAGFEDTDSGIIIKTQDAVRGNCTIQNSGGLMASPGHRKNILERRFEYIGIGIIHGIGEYPDGTEGPGIWVTQNFATF